MKKNVLTFGIISGMIITAHLLFSSTMIYVNTDSQPNIILNIFTLAVGLSLIFFAVWNYREKFHNGVINFKEAFLCGFYTAALASSIYLVVWLLDFYLFIPDFMEKYAEFEVNKARNEGATAEELSAKIKEMENFQQLYKNPIWVILLTLAEVLPMGTLIALISALILKRKKVVV